MLDVDCRDVALPMSGDFSPSVVIQAGRNPIVRDRPWLGGWNEPRPGRLTPIALGSPGILIIDDDAFLVRLIARTLGPEVRVLKATDGQSAIALAVQERPDLMILDYSLPDIPGDEVCRRLKRSRPLHHSKIVMLTGHDLFFTLGHAGEAGADGFLTKPFRPVALLDLVASLLQGATLARGDR